MEKKKSLVITTKANNFAFKKKIMLYQLLKYIWAHLYPKERFATLSKELKQKDKDKDLVTKDREKSFLFPENLC